MQRESACLEEDQDRQRQPVDGRAGLELFRRAIQGRDEMAWEQIYQQWNRLLLHWLFQHPSARLALEQAPPESYVTAALSKLWQATALAERPKRDFSNLAGALAYVRSCLNSVVLDAVRQALARQCEVGEEALAEAVMGQQSAEIAGDLWRCIERALPDRRERMLVYLRYMLGYWPHEIVATHPLEFPDVDEVYQTERNILQRLSRHPAFAGWKR